MEQKKLIIAGKSINLSFSMADWQRLEDEICTVEELDQVITKKGRIKSICKILTMLAHDDTVSEDWLILNMKPNQLKLAVQLINKTIIGAITRKEDDGTAHDVVLEELSKKADEAD